MVEVYLLGKEYVSKLIGDHHNGCIAMVFRVTSLWWWTIMFLSPSFPPTFWRQTKIQSKTQITRKNPIAHLMDVITYWNKTLWDQHFRWVKPCETPTFLGFTVPQAVIHSTIADVLFFSESMGEVPLLHFLAGNVQVFPNEFIFGQILTFQTTGKAKNPQLWMRFVAMNVGRIGPEFLWNP